MLGVVLLAPATAAAHDVITTNLTFTRDVSRILASHCVACHRTGSSIPLATYTDARPWAVAIKEQVLSRKMPPWGAVKGFGSLAPDYGLSQEDILILAAWAIGGAPEGNPALLPTDLLPKEQMKPESASAPPVKDALTIQTRMQLKEPLKVAGIRPLTNDMVDSSRVIARYPDGRIEPMVWLYRFDPKFPRTFTFRKPLIMPAGTIVESSTPLRFALETFTAPAQRTESAAIRLRKAPSPQR